tara:strand:- start:1806 stop:2276 length:471 start_codon:yes stop_codon:yes gene_type:complete
MIEKTNENVIKGPWPEKEENNSLSAGEITKEVSKVVAAQEFVNGLTQDTIVQAIHNLKTQGINIDDKNFVYEMSLIIEIMKGSIYRSIGFSYPTQMISGLLKELSIEKEALLSFTGWRLNQEQVKELLLYLETVENQHLIDDDNNNNDDNDDPDLA